MALIVAGFVNETQSIKIKKFERFIFYIVFFQASAEFICFNLIPDFQKYYYHPWPAGVGTTYTEPFSNVYRFWGVFGHHPGTTTLAACTMAIFLDKSGNTVYFRMLALILGAISLSGVGYLSFVCVALSLLLERRKFFKFLIPIVSIAVVISAVAGLFGTEQFSVIFSRVTFNYVSTLLQIKEGQILNLLHVLNTNPVYILIGLPDQINHFHMLSDSEFAGTDFGVIYRLGTSGFLGLLLFLLQTTFIWSLGKNFLSTSDRFILFCILILYFVHYSPFNIATAVYSTILVLCLSNKHNTNISLVKIKC